MPSPATLEVAAPALRSLRPQLSKSLRSSQLADVVQAVDEALLVGVLRLSTADVAALREARDMMAARRASRSGGPR